MKSKKEGKEKEGKEKEEGSKKEKKAKKEKKKTEAEAPAKVCFNSLSLIVIARQESGLLQGL